MNRIALLSCLALFAVACGAPPPLEASVAEPGALSGIVAAPKPMPVGDGPDQPEDDADADGTDASACASGPAPERAVPEVWDALTRGCEAWRARGLDSYAYVVQRSFFGPPDMLVPVVVQVEDGEVVSAVQLESRDVLDPAAFGTVDDLYFELGEFAAQGPERFDLEVDLRTGVPLEASIDWHEAAVDDWLVIEATLIEG